MPIAINTSNKDCPSVHAIITQDDDHYSQFGLDSDSEDEDGADVEVLKTVGHSGKESGNITSEDDISSVCTDDVLPPKHCGKKTYTPSSSKSSKNLTVNHHHPSSHQLLHHRQQ